MKLLSNEKDRLQLASNNTEIKYNMSPYGFFGGMHIFGANFLALSEINCNHFREILNNQTPKSIIDTRRYPDFFGIFPSIEYAIKVFANLGISYNSIRRDENYHFSQDQIKNIRCVIDNHKKNGEILIIESTKISLDMVFKSLRMAWIY